MPLQHHLKQKGIWSPTSILEEEDTEMVGDGKTSKKMDLVPCTNSEIRSQGTLTLGYRAQAVTIGWLSVSQSILSFCYSKQHFSNILLCFPALPSTRGRNVNPG